MITQPSQPWARPDFRVSKRARRAERLLARPPLRLHVNNRRKRDEGHRRPTGPARGLPGPAREPMRPAAGGQVPESRALRRRMNATPIAQIEGHALFQPTPAAVSAYRHSRAGASAGRPSRDYASRPAAGVGGASCAGGGEQAGQELDSRSEGEVEGLRPVPPRPASLRARRRDQGLGGWGKRGIRWDGGRGVQGGGRTTSSAGWPLPLV